MFVSRVATSPTAVKDAAGQSWSPATGFVGGSFWRSHPNGGDIKGTTSDALYHTEMWGMSGWQTTVPAAGDYEVTLLTREAYFTAAGQRVMSVSAEGTQFIKDLDIYRTVGKNTALNKTFKVKVTDGVLNLGFSASVDEPVVSAIQVRQLTTLAPAPVSSTPTSVVIGGRTTALSGVNVAGDVDQLVAYTPAWGTATANRSYWLDVTVVNGVVTSKSTYPKAAGTTIPANGYVLSGHNLSADWLVGVQVGQAVELRDARGIKVALSTSGGTSTTTGSTPTSTSTTTSSPTSNSTPTSPTTSPSSPSTVTSTWPTKMIAAYKKMFSGDPGAMSSYSSNVNVVFLAFAAQHTGPLRLVGYSGQGKTSLMTDIKARQAAGGKVSVSIGGAGNPINTSNTTTFVNDFAAIGTDLGFVPDGIDWDLEHWNNTSEIVAISKALKSRYGANFGVTYSVGGVGSQADIDNRVNTGVALQQAGALDAFSWQLYDTVVDLATAKWRLGTLTQAGLPASKVTVGMMLGSDNNHWDNAECLAYMRDIKASLGLTKTALWTEGWSSADNQWAADMKSVIG